MAPHRPHRADGKTECGPFSLPCDSVVRPAVCRAWWPAGGAPLSSLGGSLPVALCWLCEVGPRSDSVRAAAHATGQGAHTHQECTAHRSGGCRSETSANRGWVPGEALSELGAGGGRGDSRSLDPSLGPPPCGTLHLLQCPALGAVQAQLCWLGTRCGHVAWPTSWRR